MTDMADLPALFARDPLTLTRENISTIIGTMRNSRKAFNLGNAKAGSTKPLSEAAKKRKELSDSLDIKLDL